MPRPKILPLILLGLTALAPPGWTQAVEPEPVPGGEPRSLLPGIEQRFRLAAPDSGDWSSEDLGARASELLGELGKTWKGDALDEADLDWVAEDARIHRLRPEELEEATGAGLFRHARGADPAALASTGPAALVEALTSLGRAFEAPRGSKFKVVGVVVGEDRVQTRVDAAVYGSRDGHLWEGHARWVIDWARVDDQLELRSLEVHDYAESGGGERTLFEDVTAELLSGAPRASHQLARGLEHWRARLDASLGIGLLGHHGVAVGDVNGDGLEDLYLAQPGGMPNLLLLALEEGGFEERTGHGADFMDPTRGALLVDLDGDDDRDLVIGVVDEVLLCTNDGAGHFTVREAHPVPSVTGLAAADIDGDGDLDLYACGYVTPYDDEATPVPYHDANNGQPNSLLLNEGLQGFRDATAELGLDVNNRRFSFACSFEDHDDDGDPDLYVANDFGRNNLFRNEGGRFVDVAAEAGVEDIGAGMGVTWGDVDLDGHMDLYVSNMWSSAGQRVGGQELFHGDVEADRRSDLLRHARGSSLFLGSADGTFRDVSVEAGVTLGRWAWGGLLVDLDDDPWLDLCVPNGFVTGSRDDDL